MTPEKYTGIDPYGKESDMAKVVLNNYSFLPLAKIKRDGTYVLTLWILSTSNNKLNIVCGTTNELYDITTEWKRIELIFEANINGSLELGLTTGTYYIWHAKLEKGNKSSDWSPAPEDIEEAANTYTNAKFSILDGKIISEVERVDGISEKVTKFEQDFEGFTWNVDVVRNNLLSDTNVPTMTKKAGPGDKYLSDSDNETYSKGSFVAVSDLPVPGFTHVYRFECKTASSTSTAGRSLCFYSGKKVPMVDGEVYTMSMYARKVSGDGKIRFLIGYSSYPNYDNYIGVTSEWKRYSYTFTYSDSATGGTGGARCYFGASCSVVGVVDICGCKLERGEKATDWCPSDEDTLYTNNYMNFSNNGLTVGNLTNSTLGKNVLIDSDSVDIRNGAEVLARYGENIVLKHGGKDVFTIKDSKFITDAISENRMLYDVSYEVITTNSDGSIVSICLTSRTSSGRYLVANRLYVWHINAIDRYAIFKVPSDCYAIEIYHYPSRPAFLLISAINNDQFDVSCSYADGDAILDTTFNGNVWIENNADVSGTVESIPPLGIGTLNGEHLEIDNNEILAKTDNENPGVLYFNSEGGIVSINNNSVNAFRFNNGVLQGRYMVGNSADIAVYSDWVDLIKYGRNRSILEGDDLEILSPKDIVINPTGSTVFKSSAVLPNASSLAGTNSNGNLRNNIQPCNANNNCVIGYGSYENSEGATHIYGNEIIMMSNNDTNITSNNDIFISALGDVKVPSNFKVGGRYVGNHARIWSGAAFMKADQTATLTKAITDFAYGVILAFSYYNPSTSTSEDYDWEYFFVPRSHVQYNAGKGVVFGGSNPFHSSYWTKCVYIMDTKITGHDNNIANGTGSDGITYKNNSKVLRAVYGV